MSASASLRRAAQDVRRYADEQPAAGARIVDEQITAQLRRDTGDGSMSNARGKGRATTRVTTRARSATVSADGSRAIWTWLEAGTDAHEIKAKGTGKRAMLRTPYGPRKRVRGVRPKHTWREGNKHAERDVERDAVRRFEQIG